MRKSGALFYSIVLGIVAYPILSYAAFLIPWTLFAMLFVTYTRLDFKTLKIEPIHRKLLLLQAGSVLLCAAAYFVFAYLSSQGMKSQTAVLLAEGAMVCFLAPTALSAAVITSAMGGSLSRLLTYTFITNIGIAVAAPLLFTFVGSHAIPLFGDAQHAAPGMGEWLRNFFFTFSTLLMKVLPMLTLPLLAAVLCRVFVPRLFRFIEKRQSISFYLWIIGLSLIMARTTKSVVDHGLAYWKPELALALVALVAAGFQFKVGRKLGRSLHDPVSAGQALGQKNTILAIWMAQSFLHPLASLAPASYVLWQNLINSYQLKRHHKREEDNCI